MQAYLRCAFLVLSLPLVTPPPVLAADRPKTDGEIAAIAAGESEAVGERVRRQHFVSRDRPGLTESERQALRAEAARYGRQAANLHRELVTAKLKDEQSRQEYARKLVELGGLLVGRADVKVNVELKPNANPATGKIVFGTYDRRTNTVRLPDDSVTKKLDAALLTATHEVVHAVNWYDHKKSAPKDATAEQIKARDDEFLKRLKPDSVEKAEDEIRTEARARSAVNFALGGLDAETVALSDKVFKQYQDILRAHGHDPLQGVVDGTDDGTYTRQQRQSREVNKLCEGDAEGNFERSIQGQPVFGGVILGNKRTAAVTCTDLKIVQAGDDWRLLFTVDVGGKKEQVVYDQFTLDDLWAAYHVVRPSGRMKTAFRVWDQECNLVHCEDQLSGLRAGLHPALAASPIGVRCIALEVASGEVFLKDPGKKFGIDLKIALQWYDSPSTISVKDGRLVVAPSDDPDGLLLRLRLIGTSDKFLENQAELPKELADESKILAAVADILEARQLDGRGYITAEQVDLELSKVAMRSALKSHKDLKVDQKLAAEAVQASSPDLVFVDRFARTLAVLNWAADQLGDKFPAWPKDARAAHFPVESRVSEARVADLCRLPLTPVDTLDIPDRVREKGKEVWYALMNQGRQVGWAQGFVGPIKLGDGEVQTKRWLKVVLYARRMNAEVVLVRENTVNTDADGLMMRTKIVVGTATETKLELQASGGDDRLSLAMARNGKDSGPIIPADGWAKEGVVYDSTYLALSGRGLKLKKGQSEKMKSINIEDLASAGTMPDLTVTRVDASALTFEYTSPAGVSTITWDAEGFPTRIRQGGIDLEFHPTTQWAAQDRVAIRPLSVSALMLTPVEPPLPSVRGTVRWKVHTPPDSAKFPVEGDPEWKVVERPDATTVVIENAMPLVHDRTGFRRLSAEGNDGVKKWLAAGLLADSDSKQVKAFARKACEEANATTPLAKCGALQRAVSSYIVGDYAEAGVRKASATLTNPAGDCKHHAILLTSLLRAEGVPARIAHGLVVTAGEPAGVGHAWVEAYADGNWHRVDSALYGAGFESVYLRQGTLDDGDADTMFKALTQAAPLRLEQVSFTPPDKTKLSPPKAKLTAEEQTLAARVGYAVGRTKLELAIKSLAPDLGPPGDEWKQARELAGKLGVELGVELAGHEGHAFADVLNTVLACHQQTNGAERRAWEERLGVEAAAGYSISAGCINCLQLREMKGFDRLLPPVRKHLETDLKAAKVPDRLRKDLLKVVLDDPVNDGSGLKVLELLNEHFRPDGVGTGSEEVRKLIENLASQSPPKK